MTPVISQVSLQPEMNRCGSGTENIAYSVIVPCFNEMGAIQKTIEQLCHYLKELLQPAEIIVVDDGSTDGSGELFDQLAMDDSSLKILHHEKNLGYGASLKYGIHHARGPLIAITDADGTYPNDRLPEFFKLAHHADMVVGARIGEQAQYSLLRSFPKWFLTRYASWMVQRRIPDINSGLRVMRKDSVVRFQNLLPNGFSFTTTITIAMLLSNCEVHFVPISYSPRIGRSKIRPIRDTLRFFALILRTGAYFSPLRVFFPFVIILATGTILSLFYDIIFLNNLTDKTTILSLFTINSGMFALLADIIDKRTSR